MQNLRFFHFMRSNFYQTLGNSFPLPLNPFNNHFPQSIYSCERHARAAASDFAKACIHYINTNLPGNVQVTASHTDFLKRFVDCFSEHFESEFSRRRLSHQKPSNGTITSTEEESDYTEHSDVPKTTKPFFRRLSFKGLKKGKVCNDQLWQLILISFFGLNFFFQIFVEFRTVPCIIQ